LRYLVPLFLFSVPFILQGRINLRFSLRDGATGVLVSVIVLLPFWYFMSHSGKGFTMLSAGAVLYQLLGISLPEEVYFRGFLQERIGNTIKGVLMVSVLFSFMHVPQFIFYGDHYSLLTFFPSLVMGFLYWRTSNVLPSMVFHFFSNVVFLGVYDIL
jgi:membrane protease YdiL (CAAX protease family)